MIQEVKIQLSFEVKMVPDQFSITQLVVKGISNIMNYQI